MKPVNEYNKQVFVSKAKEELRVGNCPVCDLENLWKRKLKRHITPIGKWVEGIQRSLESSSVQFRSVCQSHLTLCGPHGLHHARLPCPSPTPGAHSNSCPSTRWCHTIISSSVIPFPSHLPSLPASGSFPVSQFFASGGQSIGVSTSTSVLPMSTQYLISFCLKLPTSWHVSE